MSLSPPMQPHNANDPHAALLSSSCLDFLLIELVPLAHRTTIACDSPAALPLPPSSSTVALPHTHSHTHTNSQSQSHTHTQSQSQSQAQSLAQLQSLDNASASASASVAQHAGGSVASATRRLDDDEHLDAVHFRLESQGYRVGQGLVERFSRDRPRFNDTLEVIKFICKDLWALVFGKNIDNLKTNHRGVYVLTDNLFRPFSRMSTETGSQAVIRAQPFLWFPCGIVRGALAALGINATVQAEVTELPGAVFQIKTIPFKP